MNDGREEKTASSKEPEFFILLILRKFNRLLHLILGLALLVSAIIVILLFGHDVIDTFAVSLAGGFANALGSLLILWTISELLDAEISYLHGGRFRVAVFIEVAIAATIRKILILEAEAGDVTHLGMYVLTLIALGLVYWLVQ